MWGAAAGGRAQVGARVPLVRSGPNWGGGAARRQRMLAATKRGSTSASNTCCREAEDLVRVGQHLGYQGACTVSLISEWTEHSCPGFSLFLCREAEDLVLVGWRLAF